MGKKTVRKQTKRLHLKITLVLSALIIFFFGGLLLLQEHSNSRIASDDAKNSLQLGVFYPSGTPSPIPTPTTTRINTPTPTTVSVIPPTDTPTPTPNYSAVCPPDSIVPNKTCKCIWYEKRIGICLGARIPQSCTDEPRPPWEPAQCSISGGGNVGPCEMHCVYKPVIYLYPEKPVLVDIRIETQGNIYVSDPLYPENGWKNVLASPDGSLKYDGKNYRELFYETQNSHITAPKTGISIKTSELESKLQKYIYLFGLTRADEQKEFLDFWIPRLQALNSPYVFFSILEPNEKERIDSVNISPTPNSMIQFIAYFKPLQKPLAGSAFELPSSPPKRVGFTAVEWGGTIDK